ncbi:Holliday junction resolvase RuvX [Candidatus Saganbacteria bacterium]|nr:Holliday junction resolvase RuvX [Candidatus Saganbacteria bacterium]
MRTMGIDYGEVRIGIAISDPLGLTAQGIAVVSNIDEVKNTIKQYDDISEIVVGLPKTMRGEIGHSAQKVLEFIEELKKSVTIPIVTWDERLTSSQANRMFDEAGVSEKKRRKFIDKTAAALILQNYMECRK